MLDFENKLWSSGINYIAGIDEAGRGPLAGPVVACSVIFLEGLGISIKYNEIIAIIRIIPNKYNMYLFFIYKI